VLELWAVDARRLPDRSDVLPGRRRCGDL